MRPSPKSGFAALLLTLLCLCLQEPASAQKSGKAAHQINPDYADAHLNLANTFLRLKQYRDALASYQALTDINPASADAYHGMGEAYRNLGQLAHAVDTINWPSNTGRGSRRPTTASA